MCDVTIFDTGEYMLLRPRKCVSGMCGQENAMQYSSQSILQPSEIVTTLERWPCDEREK